MPVRRDRKVWRLQFSGRPHRLSGLRIEDANPSGRTIAVRNARPVGHAAITLFRGSAHRRLRLGVQPWLVSDVRGWFELEGGVLNVKVPRHTLLQRVENLWGVATVEAVVFDHDVGREGQQS